MEQALTTADGRTNAYDHQDNATFRAMDTAVASEFTHLWQGRALDPDVIDPVRAVDPNAYRDKLLGNGLSAQAADGATARLIEIQREATIRVGFDVNLAAESDPTTTPTTRLQLHDLREPQTGRL